MSVARALVRGRDLGKHETSRLDGGKMYASTTALGLPRLWSFSTRAALDGLRRGVISTTQRGGLRLEQAFVEARDYLAARCETLIEREAPDATLTALMLADGELHVMSSGAARVYLHRRGAPQRLTPREEVSTGLLFAEPVRCNTALEPGDLVLAGSVSAFSVRAVAKVASVLEDDPRTPTAVLASLLSEPAATAGVGAAAIVLRIL